MNICVYSLFVLGSNLETGWSPIQGALSTVLDEETETKRFTDALCSKWEQLKEEEEEDEEDKKKKKERRIDKAVSDSGYVPLNYRIIIEN
jgi:hypothetical protein